MALVGKCFCCSLQIASGFFAAYLLIAYLIAFAFELIWILESDIALPAAAVLLCAEYFAMALFAALLIHGLATKSFACLIAWMFSVTVLTFPEAAMVIYMSIQYWKIESLYGVTELACWLIRIIINVIELILIQSLYVTWKEEEMTDKRLRDLNMAAIAVQNEHFPPLNSQFYHNNGYEHSIEQLSCNLRRYGSVPQLYQPNNLLQIPLESYQFCTTQSEFNASIFAPNLTNATTAYNDQLLITGGKKCQSLIDLRFIESSDNNFNNYLNNSNDNLTNLTTKCQSVDNLNEINKGDRMIIKNRTGFYAQPVTNYGVPIYYGPLDGPDFLIYKKQVDRLTSKNSLSNASADDVQKYRDVAL